MTPMKSEGYNQILFSEDRFLIFFYRTEEPTASLQEDILKQIEELIPSPCRIYSVNADEEPMIAERFSIEKTPSIVVIRNKRVHVKKTGLTEYKEVLSMLR